jgi:hypothetical protein
MQRRELLVSGAAWVTLVGGAKAQPRTGIGMTATLSVPPQPSGAANAPVPSGTFEFAEAGGPNQTVRTLSVWNDPRGAFILTKTRITRSDFRGLRVEFVRSTDGRWASVEFHWGAVGPGMPQPHNIGAGYTATIAGDFATASPVMVPYHSWNAGWRLSGSRAGGLRPGRNDWPYVLTPYTTLVNERLIPPFQFNHLWKYPAAPYTPMGRSSLEVSMQNVGGRSDIGPFTGWDAHYLQTQVPGAPAAIASQAASALHDLMEIAEATHSIPWYAFDAQHGCLWDVLINNPGGENPVQNQDTLGPTFLSLVFSGTPGTIIPERTQAHDTATKASWFTLSGASISAGGTSPPVVARSLGFGWGLSGSPFAMNAAVAGVTSVAVAPGTVILGCPWDIDTAHCPDTGYVPYILFRDPWDLLASQANAMFSATTTGGRWSVGQPRSGAWDHRTAAHAYQATPANGVPNWLLPRSTMDKWVSIQQQWLFNHMIDHQDSGYPQLATVFHMAEAANIGGNAQQYCKGAIKLANGQFSHPWQDAFFTQAAALMLLARPGDAYQDRILTYFATGVDDRYNGTSGWPNTVPTMYAFKMMDKVGGPVYSSWAQAWQANAPIVLNCSPTTEPPAKLTFNCGGSNYPNNDLAALSLAVIAGQTRWRRTRDYLFAIAARQVGCVDDSLSFAQV